MCGIAGIWEKANPSKVNEESLIRMGQAMIHRGPDDEGVWLDNDAGVGLVHRRLSIVDLSSAGHQPMESDCGKWVIVFNGEIYNHQKIKAHLSQIKDIKWRGHSDTEVLLAAISTLGLNEALRLSVGMFAFAAWNRDSSELYVARDRIGEKPLYFLSRPERFVFASELSCIEAVSSDERLTIDRDALSQLVRVGYISAPASIYEQVKKLMPGQYLKVGKGEVVSSTQYWSIEEVLEKPRSKATYEDSVDELESLLSQSIKEQMLADVTVGAFLSGGVDSSTIAALMQIHSQKPIKTFSIGFHDESYNEAEFAAKVAEHLGTEHTELYVSEKELLETVEELPRVFSEPFGDSSQLPMYLVSKMAKEHVTVCLSGDGGDELFSGYRRYELSLRAWQKLNSTPALLKKLASVAVDVMPVGLLNSAGRLIKRPMLGDKLKKGSALISSRDFEDFYRNYLMASYKNCEKLVLNGSDGLSALQCSQSVRSSLSKHDLMTTLDLLDYLPNDILCKVDRCAMGVSLEGRIPLLDHRVIDFALRTTQEIKFKDKVTKSPLRDVLYRHVPRDLIERPKKGFAVPLDKWLRRELKPWAENLLDYTQMERDSYFDTDKVRTLWSEHSSGTRNWSQVLWNILMFQAWLEKRRK